MALLIHLTEVKGQVHLEMIGHHLEVINQGHLERIRLLIVTMETCDTLIENEEVILTA